MPLSHWPNGVSANLASVANTSAGAGDVDCTDVFASGAITGATGSIYGGKVSYAITGSPGTVALTSALYDSSAIIFAPFKCLPEIVWVAGATGSVTVSIRVTAGSVSTATAVCTLTVGSATTEALTTYTTIGGTALGQGSFMHVTSAVMATANSSGLMINLIPVA